MPNLIVTGANRGIGLEYVRQYASAGWTVHATCRQPEKATALTTIKGDVTIHALDVSSISDIQSLANHINHPFDVVIANAGIMGGANTPRGAGQQFGSLDYAAWLEVLQINTLSAVATCEAFVPHLQKGEMKKLVATTSLMGSIEDASGGFTAYRSSKTALNMAMSLAAFDLQQDGIAVGVLHPGWVKTDMGGESAPTSATESVSGMRDVIAGLTPGPKAVFKDFTGKTLPW